MAAGVIVTLLFVNHNHGTSIPNEPLTTQSTINKQLQTPKNDAVNTIAPSAPEAITNNIPIPRKVQKTQKSIKDKPVENEEVASIIEEPTHEEYAVAEPITPPIQKVVSPTNDDPYANNIWYDLNYDYNYQGNDSTKKKKWKKLLLHLTFHVFVRYYNKNSK